MYELTTEVLGKGARSCVTTAVRKSTGKEFAVKVVPKTSEREREKVLREVEILYLCRENEYVLISVSVVTTCGTACLVTMVGQSSIWWRHSRTRSSE